MGHEDDATRPPEMIADLSEIELSVLRRLVDGADSKQVAADLSLSEAQVHAHERTIYDKLRVEERLDRAAEHVRTHGLPPPIRTHRARWIVLGVVLLLVLGLALYWFNRIPVTVMDSDGPRTWIIGLGETVTLSSDEVGPNDRYRCAGEESGIEFTPVRGTESYSEAGGLSVRNANGTVTAYCQPGPPGDS